MTDHAVLIPTSEGLVGGIVSEPEGPLLAGLIIYPGYGRPARSGVNSFWTRIARDLAEQGVCVLRVDHSRDGETLPIGEGVTGQWRKSRLDLRLQGQVLEWFRERLIGLDIFLAGACAGARIAIEMAGSNSDAVARTFLIVPHLGIPLDNGQADGAGPSTGHEGLHDVIDPIVVEHFRSILDRAPSWILLGEHDRTDLPILANVLGEQAAGLEVEVVPETAIHLLDQPGIQEQAGRRLKARIIGALSGAGIS